MLPDAGGTFLTKHCVAIAWFPHEPIDAVAYYILCSCVSKLEKTGYREAIAQQNGTKDAFTVSEMEAAFEKTLGPTAGSPATGKIRGRNHLFFCGWSVWKRRKRNETTCSGPRRRKDFQVGSEDWNEPLYRTKNSLDTRFPKRAVH